MLPSERDAVLWRMRGWAVTRATGLLPPDEVEDAAQVVTLAVWDALGRLRPGVDPWPFLVVVARGALVRYAGQFYARSRPVGAGEDVPTRYDTTEATALDLVEHPAISDALAQLAPRERAAVVLVDMCDVRPDDASRLLGLSPRAGALRQARRRAHAKLRDSLAHLQEVPA
ncbi:sigma-70 family RNA polymerase sigma factor [Micromonospora chokoriensis]